MGQCQECHQKVLTSAANCSDLGKADHEDSEGDDFVVDNLQGSLSRRNAPGQKEDGLLAIWKWDENSGQDKPRGYQEFQTDSPWERRDQGTEGPATLVLSRHLLLNPHLRYKFGDCYVNKRKVGSGTYGDVYEAHSMFQKPVHSLDFATAVPVLSHVAEEQKSVAVKAFQVEAQASDPQEDKQKLVEFARRRASFEAERAALAQIEHPHIVKMHECFEEKGHLYIVLELCRGGELYERIANEVKTRGGRGFQEGLSRHLFRQMLYAIGYLHANRIVHRDIKTENFLLLGETGTDDANVLKLCDFGTAVRLSSQRPRSNGRVGTLSYIAPEVYANRGADICADVWSLGVVLYLILVGANPFRNSQTKTKVATVQKIEAGDFDQDRPFWQELSEDSKQLIKSLLVLKEEKRLTCEQALHHSWVERPEPLDQQGGLKSMIHAPAMSTPRAGSNQDPVAHASSVLMLLMRFTGLDPMQKVVLAAASQTVSEKDFEIGPASIPWYQLFVMLDADGDGCLSFQEFTSGFKEMLGSGSVADEKLLALARALDTDGSGAIEWGEWLALALLTLDTLGEAPDLRSTAFRLLDRPTGDGTIGAADLLAVVGTSDNTSRVQQDAARAQVLQALSTWQTQRLEDRKGVAKFAPPSLVEKDVGQVLQSVGMRQDGI